MRPAVHVAEWRELADGFGDALAVEGEHTLAASSSGVWIWKGRDLLRTVIPTRAFAVGAPRLCAGRVLYGTGRETDESGFHALALPATPGAPRAAAWTADGSRVAVLWVHGGDGQIRELAADGLAVRDVWTGTDPPQALWCGASAIVGVGRQLRAWTAHGMRVADGHAGGVASVSAARDESLLLTVGFEGTAKLWRTDTWTSSSELRGDWTGGSLAPSGRHGLLINRRGTLEGFCVRDGETALVGEIAVPGSQPVAIALGDDRVVGSFREGARVRSAEVHVRCD